MAVMYSNWKQCSLPFTIQPHLVPVEARTQEAGENGHEKPGYQDPARKLLKDIRSLPAYPTQLGYLSSL